MITVTAYDAEHIHHQEITNLDELQTILNAWRTVWIAVTEPEKPETIEQLAKIFNLHQLALEDLFTKRQRAKIEQYEDNFFIIAHELSSKDEVISKQLCFFLGKNYVLSFQNEALDSMKVVSEKIISNHGPIRSNGADYLAYAMLDATVDTYFPILEDLGEQLEDLEDIIIENPSRQAISSIHNVKRELLTVRRTAWPMREVINTLLRDASFRLCETVRFYLRDCYDHAVEIIDLTETYRELGADLMDVYLSSISNRMNEIMKVLTIIATVFAPPAFIAAIYGMNFNRDISPYNMPETNWYYGYPIILLVMLLTSCTILVFLWHKGWLEGLMSSDSNKKQ